MKRFIILFSFLFALCSSAYSQATGLVDLKFGQYQIADSQWNVSACMYTSTCEIYSKNPGTAYKIPWTSGQLSWSAGDYIAFLKTGDATNPWNAVQYTSNGTQKAVMGTGHIINMGSDFFFFVGNDNNTGQLFSMTQGFSDTSGLIWTGTLNPTLAQVDAYATGGSTTPLAAGQTYTSAPSLCCGGSADPFNADAGKSASVMTFTNRTTSDSKVFIEQIGNFNTITVQQTGTKNNYVDYYGNGSSNSISITQTGSPTTIVNYTDLSVTGNSNTVSITQTSSGGSKATFAEVLGNSNSLIVVQKDSGSHWADVSLLGSNKNVDITQQGSAGHMARVTLSGNPTDLSLTQSGSTQNFYSINFNCATSGGCAKITVTQGQ